MSLNRAEMAQTSAEIKENMRLGGLNEQELQELTGLDDERFNDALSVQIADPRDVWLLRDKAETAARLAGKTPVAYTFLTEEKRRAAAGWFGVRDER